MNSEWIEEWNPAVEAADWARLTELARDPGLRERALAWCGENMKVYTLEQAAEVLQVHPRTVRNWVRSGELRAADLGHKVGYRIAEGDLEAFLVGRVVVPKVEQADNDQDQGDA